MPIALAAAIERAINDADPMGLLKGGAPADEYGPEIGTIVPRVVNALSVDEITAVLYEEFVRWFGDDTAGPRHAYETAAARSGRLSSNSKRAPEAAELRVRPPSGRGQAIA